MKKEEKEKGPGLFSFLSDFIVLYFSPLPTLIPFCIVHASDRSEIMVELTWRVKV